MKMMRQDQGLTEQIRKVVANVLSELDCQDKSVKLNKIRRGGSKKFQVCTTDPGTGNRIKVSFGDPGMEIKRDDPERRKSFRARHNCDDKTFKKDRDKAGYWSCRTWESGTSVSDMTEGDMDESASMIMPSLARWKRDNTAGRIYKAIRDSLTDDQEGNRQLVRDWIRNRVEDHFQASESQAIEYVSKIDDAMLDRILKIGKKKKKGY